MVRVYNEEDIIGEVIQHLISQGVEPVILDNGSTDSSYEICKRFADKGLIELREYKSSSHLQPLTYRMIYDIALTRKPDWLIINDADEILESGTNNVTLREAIENEDAEGYNLIQFDLFEFFLTNNDSESAPLVKERLRYYSWQHDLVYRAWKFVPGARIGDYGGHFPIFPDTHTYRISPRKFVLRHYRFRSREQAKRKTEERLTRRPNVVFHNKDWHPIYQDIERQDFHVIADYRLLTKYLGDNSWNREWKFHPYSRFNWGAGPSRDKVFSNDGRLRKHYPTINELKLQLEEKKQEIRVLKERLARTNQALVYESKSNQFNKIATVSLNVIMNKGFITFCREVVKKIRKREFKILDTHT